MLEPLTDAVRSTLLQAIADRRAVAIVVRGDLARSIAARQIEGRPYRLQTMADGRERVRLQVAEGSEQVVLLERILLVRAIY